MKINNTLKLIIAVVVSELAGVIGAVFTMPSIPSWYAKLAKPDFAPPNWIFAPVWITLFALMGIAAFFVWRKGLEKKDVKIALAIFIGQLVLNIFWSIIFFGLHSLLLAFVEIIFLWLAILATIIAFAKISKPAALLLIPYILWVSFASYLNYSIWQINLSIKPEQVACTQEAKQCSDGSYVGRSRPNCEFAKCPEIKTNGIVKGSVLLGPTCPVVRIPPDPACADKPYKTTIQVIRIGSPQSSPFTTTQSNNKGQYEITLPAGEYALQPVGGNILPRCETKNITVEENETQEINLFCDTGIR